MGHIAGISRAMMGAYEMQIAQRATAVNASLSPVRAAANGSDSIAAQAIIASMPQAYPAQGAIRYSPRLSKVEPRHGLAMHGGSRVKAPKTASVFDARLRPEQQVLPAEDVFRSHNPVESQADRKDEPLNWAEEFDSRRSTRITLSEQAKAKAAAQSTMRSTAKNSHARAGSARSKITLTGMPSMRFKPPSLPQVVTALGAGRGALALPVSMIRALLLRSDAPTVVAAAPQAIVELKSAHVMQPMAADGLWKTQLAHIVAAQILAARSRMQPLQTMMRHMIDAPLYTARGSVPMPWGSRRPQAMSV